MVSAAPIVAAVSSLATSKIKATTTLTSTLTVIGMKNKNYSTEFRPGMGLREERKTREEIMKGEERKIWQD